MNLDEDTCEWLGIPTPLEMYQQHGLLLENEIQELNLQLRKARENIFGLVKMNDELVAENKTLRGYLTASGAQSAEFRREISRLNTLSRVYKREIDELRITMEGAGIPLLPSVSHDIS